MVGADGEHTPRVMFGVDFDDGDRVPHSVLDGFARDAVPVGGRVNMRRGDNTCNITSLITVSTL